MPRLSALFFSLGLVTLLAGCQTGPGAGGDAMDVTPNAVAGDAIEVTALDATTGGEAAPPTGAEATVQPQSAPPETEAETEAAPPEPAPKPDLGEAEPEAEPVPAKSEGQIACEKKKGQWITATGTAHTCVFSTGDAGKLCTKGTQCEGDCLARSGTCSPIKPLLGCNDILQDDGSTVTLCVE